MFQNNCGVEIRALDATRVADRTALLAAADALPLAHQDLREVPVERLEVAAVIDDHQPAVARVAAGVDHLAGAARGHGLAERGLDVDAGMHLAAVAGRRFANAERPGDHAADPPARRRRSGALRPPL